MFAGLALVAYERWACFSTLEYPFAPGRLPNASGDRQRFTRYSKDVDVRMAFAADVQGGRGAAWW